jgi:probable F420-dependent oxidoreductase
MDFWASIAFLDTDVQLDAARASEACGLAGMTVPDHLFFAQDYRSTYPYTADGNPLWRPDTHYPDPFSLISAMSAVTSRIRFATNIYVAPARDLFTVAKGLSTAAVISKDRVALGVGVGWCEDEFLQTGQDFHTRGKRLDEMLDVLPKLFTGRMVEHHGEFYDFDPLQMAPVPAKPVPVIVGGNSKAAMRRAARHDGWIPAASTKPEDFVPMLDEMTKLRSEAGKTGAPFEIIVALHALPDADLYKRFADLGVSGVMCAPWLSRAPAKDGYGYDAQHVNASIEQFAEDIIAKVNG